MNDWLKKHVYLAPWLSAAAWSIALLIIVVRMVAF